MKVPSTSREAWQAKQPTIQTDHDKILQALGILGKSNYETIAVKAGLDRHAVGRRLSELEKDGKIYKPGTTSPTKTNRKAFDYCLTEPVKVDAKPAYRPAPSIMQQRQLW